MSTYVAPRVRTFRCPIQPSWNLPSLESGGIRTGFNQEEGAVRSSPTTLRAGPFPTFRTDQPMSSLYSNTSTGCTEVVAVCVERRYVKPNDMTETTSARTATYC